MSIILYLYNSKTDIKKTMEKEMFVVKCYEKCELAALYFPDLCEQAAVDKLRRWIRKCGPLMEEIRAAGFHPKMKAFTVREVRLITYYLGKPGDF